MSELPSLHPDLQSAQSLGDDRRRMITADIHALLARVRDNKLELLRQMLQVPNSRVFLPRSSQGPSLFSRIVDLDVLFAKAEQKLLRDADPYPAYEAKARVERDICELHVLLIELCAELAATYALEPTDPAVIEAVKRLKKLRARGDPLAGGGRPEAGSRSSERNGVNGATPSPPPAVT